MRLEWPPLPWNYKLKEAEGKIIRVLALASFRDAWNLSTTAMLNDLISEENYLIHDLKKFQKSCPAEWRILEIWFEWQKINYSANVVAE